MPMEPALVGRLQQSADIALFAGVQFSWFGFNRSERGPRIALTLVTPGEEWTHDGPDGLNDPRVRFDILGEDAAQITDLAHAVTREMHLEADVEGIRFHPAQLGADRTLDPEESSGGEQRFQRQLEFLFYYEELS